MEQKILSVIIPSCNMEKYLPTSLAALKGFPSLEVLVVNDGSKDRTSEIAHQFEQEDTSVFRVIDKPNGHYGSCINAGLAAATGVFVKIMDADDSFDPSALKTLIEKLTGFDRQGFDAILTDFVMVYEDGSPDICVKCPLPAERQLSIADLAAAPRVVTMHSIAYRTSVLREMHYHQTEGMPYTDNEWALIPMQNVRKMIYEPQPLYRYLIGRSGQSVSPVQMAKNIKHLETISAKMIDTGLAAQGNPVFKEYARKFAKDNVGHVCDVAFFAMPVKEGVRKIKEWRERLAAEWPEVMEDVEKQTLDSRVPVAYFRVLRKAGSLGGCWMRFARMLKHFMEMQRHLRGI